MINSKRKNARLRLDRRLAALGPHSRFAVPPKGWIRAIRDALGMSAAGLAQRLGVTPQSVADLERSEAQGTVQLNSLRRAAEALDCTVVYALVPNSSLEGTFMRRARAIASRQLDRIGHSMDLEDQGLSAAEREAQIDAYIAEHLSDRDLWRQM